MAFLLPQFKEISVRKKLSQEKFIFFSYKVFSSRSVWTWTDRVKDLSSHNALLCPTTGNNSGFADPTKDVSTSCGWSLVSRWCHCLHHFLPHGLQYSDSARVCPPRPWFVCVCVWWDHTHRRLSASRWAFGLVFYVQGRGSLHTH